VTDVLLHWILPLVVGALVYLGGYIAGYKDGFDVIEHEDEACLQRGRDLLKTQAEIRELAINYATWVTTKTETTVDGLRVTVRNGYGTENARRTIAIALDRDPSEITLVEV
jgi:hypothetical protein